MTAFLVVVVLLLLMSVFVSMGYDTIQYDALSRLALSSFSCYCRERERGYYEYYTSPLSSRSLSLASLLSSRELHRVES